MKYDELVKHLQEPRPYSAPPIQLQAADAITTLQAELEQCRKDAERYRALRKSNLDDIDVCTGFYAVDVGSSGVAAAYEEILYGEKLDAAIDKAMESV